MTVTCRQLSKQPRRTRRPARTGLRMVAQCGALSAEHWMSPVLDQWLDSFGSPGAKTRVNPAFVSRGDKTLQAQSLLTKCAEQRCSLQQHPRSLHNK